MMDEKSRKSDDLERQCPPRGSSTLLYLKSYVLQTLKIIQRGIFSYASRKSNSLHTTNSPHLKLIMQRAQHKRRRDTM